MLYTLLGAGIGGCVLYMLCEIRYSGCYDSFSKLNQDLGPIIGIIGGGLIGFGIDVARMTL